MTTPGDPVHDLSEAVRAARAAAAEASFPLPLPSAGAARADRAAVLAQVDDYLLPRLARLDAPLLVAVAGSTGAGKSTLVNSLVQAPVSPVGVLRPTTRTPVLACHPADAAWFRRGGPLTRTAPGPPIVAPALTPGLALLDVPDIDSVEDANRSLAQALLAAADLWLFVTTGARYADAVPWDVLRAARDRGTVVALVLGRVPAAVPSGSTVDLVAHLTELLTHQGLAGAPLFVVPETRVDGQRLLPDAVLSPLRNWVDRLAADAHARDAVARCTLEGALAALPSRLAALAAAADEQATTAEELAEAVGLAYGGARAVLERGLTSATGQAAHHPAAPAAQRAGRSADQERRATWEAGLVRLVCSAAAAAAEQAALAWQRQGLPGSLPAGPQAGASAGLVAKVERLARGWDGGTTRRLLGQLGELLDAEAAGWLDGLARVPPGGGPARRLHTAAVIVDRARQAVTFSADAAGRAPASAAEPSAGWSAQSPAAARVELDRAGR